MLEPPPTVPSQTPNQLKLSPDDPEVPDSPDEPLVPDSPDEPLVPDSPDDPEVPATPPVPEPPTPGTNGHPIEEAVVLLIFI